MVAASRMKLARVGAGLTLLEVFARTGIQPGRLSMLERGLVAFKGDEVTKLARALGCDVAEPLVEPRPEAVTVVSSACV